MGRSRSRSRSPRKHKTKHKRSKSRERSERSSSSHSKTYKHERSKERSTKSRYVLAIPFGKYLVNNKSECLQEAVTISVISLEHRHVNRPHEDRHQAQQAQEVLSIPEDGRSRTIS